MESVGSQWASFTPMEVELRARNERGGCALSHVVCSTTAECLVRIWGEGGQFEMITARCTRAVRSCGWIFAQRTVVQCGPSLCGSSCEIHIAHSMGGNEGGRKTAQAGRPESSRREAGSAQNRPERLEGRERTQSGRGTRAWSESWLGRVSECSEQCDAPKRPPSSDDVTRWPCREGVFGEIWSRAARALSREMSRQAAAGRACPATVARPRPIAPRTFAGPPPTTCRHNLPITFPISVSHPAPPRPKLAALQVPIDYSSPAAVHTTLIHSAHPLIIYTARRRSTRPLATSFNEPRPSRLLVAHSNLRSTTAKLAQIPFGIPINLTARLIPPRPASGTDASKTP